MAPKGSEGLTQTMEESQSQGQATRARYCPQCGEPVGSFWGRSSDDDATWCESCQTWFRVVIEPQ